jgi:RNA methyltransferase, TrmH family
MMISEVVSSSNNRWIKAARDLATSSRARSKAGLIFLEGLHLCEAFLESPLSNSPVDVEVMLVGQAFYETAAAQTCVSHWQSRNGKVVLLLDKLFSEITQVENGPAIAMLVLTPEYFVTPTTRSSNQDVVYLDGIQDPGNAGTILRTAAACGVSAVYTSGTTVSMWSPKVLRSAMGAHFHVAIRENQSIEELFDHAQRTELSIFVTTGQATKTIFETNLKTSAVWVLGNEGQGVNVDNYSLVKARNSSQVPLHFVKIPQQGVESLNVASAAAVCIYEQWRQRNVSLHRG